MAKYYNFQARVSEKNVPEEDFKFLERELAKGVSMTAIAHEALTALRKLKQGDLVEINKIQKYLEIKQVTKQPQKEVAANNELEDKIFNSLKNFKTP